MTDALGSFLVPLVLVCAALLIAFSRNNLTDAFFSGAKDGIRTALGLLPGLLLLLPAIRMFAASGITEAAAALLAPILDRLGLTADVLPVLLVRPLSGSASNGMLHALHTLLGTNGADALFAGVFYGTCDTVYYILPCYFSAAGIKNARYAALAAGMTAVSAAVFAYVFSRIII